MNTQLTTEEVRVIGCLMEKAVTTPDHYPLTLNSLTNACNQKSSRDPVMNLDAGEVERICRQLDEKHLIRIEEGFKNNSKKYAHRLCNTLLGKNQFNPAEYAIISMLLLRGPQTPGELRSRSGRLYNFESNHEVIESLKALIERDSGAIVARLAKRPGRQDHEYIHLYTKEYDSVPEDPSTIQRAPISERDLKVKKLELRVQALEIALTDLAERLGEEIDLDTIVNELSQTNN